MDKDQWNKSSHFLYYYQMDDSGKVENVIIDALQKQKCRVYRYYEEYYDINSLEPSIVSIRNIGNCELLFGDGKQPEVNKWVMEKIETNHETDLCLISEIVLDSKQIPSSEKIVRFNIIEFEVEHDVYHLTAFQVVFLNGWHKQYFTICCEKFMLATEESYNFEKNINNLKDLGELHMSKYQIYCEHFQRGHFWQKVRKFRPSFVLIDCLIESVTKNQYSNLLSLSQIECLFTLCQQIPLLKKENLEEIVEQLEVFYTKHIQNPDLFSAILPDRWDESHNSVQVFQSWAFFPFQKITQHSYLILN